MKEKYQPIIVLRGFYIFKCLHINIAYDNFCKFGQQNC